MLVFHNIDELLIHCSKKVLEEKKIIHTRGSNTKELINSSLMLENPLNRCISNPCRKWSFPLALGEFSWHLSASNDVQDLAYYSKSWKNFAKNGLVPSSCYGQKLFGQRSRWSEILDQLKFDNNSRRAVFSFFDNKDILNNQEPDVSCTISIQFLLRNNRLHAFVNMRSNDLIMGLPYDVFLFTMLQEKMASELNVEIGSYYHNATSLHIYERHFDLAEEIRDSQFNSYFEMPKMTHGKIVNSFLDQEKKIRSYGLEMNYSYLDQYWEDLKEALISYRYKKDGDSKNATNFIKSKFYEPVLEPYIK